jgi:hypothetical protein
MRQFPILTGIAVSLVSACLAQESATTPVEADQQQAAAEAAVEQASPLDGLDWLVGTWVDEGEESRIVTECSWTNGNRFLKRSFSVLIDNEVTLKGDQFIGWDPIEQRIRSWTFDSEGGIGEGRWYQDGNRWLVKTSFTLATGERASATNIITYIDGDTVTWQSIGREIAGELMPSIPEVTVVRQKDADNDSEKPAGENS